MDGTLNMSWFTRSDDDDFWSEVIHPPTPFEPLEPPDEEEDDPERRDLDE